jgi:cytochrome o ubiquinol oxidase subunit IV
MIRSAPPAHRETIGGAAQGTLPAYLAGFIFSVVLTITAFALVIYHVLPPTALICVVIILATVQILVHLTCFLHLNTGSESRWNLTVLLFTAFVLVLLIGGSLWIMTAANQNMMLVPADITRDQIGPPTAQAEHPR